MCREPLGTLMPKHEPANAVDRRPQRRFRISFRTVPIRVTARVPQSTRKSELSPETGSQSACFGYEHAHIFLLHDDSFVIARNFMSEGDFLVLKTHRTRGWAPQTSV